MTWVQTISGRAVDLLDPNPAQISLVDIAYSLARKPRFNGHVRGHYSVAEHCCWVSEVSEDGAWGLLHDAHEAYTGDIPSPVKAAIRRLVGGTDPLARIEQALDEAIASALKVSIDREAVEAADLDMLSLEREQLVGAPCKPWTVGGVRPMIDIVLKCWPPEVAERQFLERAMALGIGWGG